MPDTLKQFYNATINVTGLTGAQTAPLFTNSATTRAVIKDIDVANTFPVQPNLTVGGTAVATLSGSLTGSEIVDTSQAVAMSFPAPLQFSQLNLQYLTVVTPPGSRTVTSSFRINGISVRDTSAVLANTTSSTYNNIGYHYVAADNDVFFVNQNGVADFRLSKCAGGPGGTYSDIVAGTWPVAFDGRYYYYLTSTTNLRRFDPETETTTDTTIAAVNTASTSARLIHSNGYLMYLSNNNGYPYIIKISNGFWSQQIGYSSFSGIFTNNARSMPGFFIDPVTLVVTTLWVDSSNITYRARSPGAVSSFTVASEAPTTVPSLVTKATGTWGPIGTTPGSPVVAMTSANTGIMHFTSGPAAYLVDFSSSDPAAWVQTSDRLNATGLSNYDFFFSSSTPTPTVNATNFPNTISLRITGVEVTP